MPTPVANVALSMLVAPPDNELVEADDCDWRVTVVEKLGAHCERESETPVS